MANNLIWTNGLVNGFWDEVSSSRLDELSFAKLNGEKLFNLVRGRLPKAGDVLDFGAGSGHFCRLLLDKGYRVSAFDPSGDRESNVIKLVGSHPNFLGLEKGDGERRYDVVVFSEVIEHLLEADYELVLRQVAALVKPGGLVVVTTPNQEDLGLKQVYCPQCQHFFHPWQHVRSFTPEKIVETFERFGYQRDLLALIDFSNDAPDLDYGKTTRMLADQIGTVLNGIKERSEQKAHRSWFAGLFDRFWYLMFGEDSKDEAQLYDILSRAHNELVNCAFPTKVLDGKSELKPLQQQAKYRDDVDMRTGNASTIVYVGRALVAG